MLQARARHEGIREVAGGQNLATCREYADRVLLTDALTERHLAWAEDAPLAQEWRRKKKVNLEWWREVLAGRDARFTPFA